MPTRFSAMCPLGALFLGLTAANGLTAQCNLVADLQTQVLSVNSSNPTGFSQGPGGTVRTEFLQYGGYYYFSAETEAAGIELWRTDGTAAGTSMLKDINPGSGDGTPWALFVANGLLFFGANDGVHGQELWRSDGTEAGTFMVADIKPGAGHSGPNHFARLGGEVFFSAASNSVTTLWRSNGTAAGTAQMLDSNLAWVRSPQSLRTNSNGTEIYFSASVINSAPRLYKTNGTTAGTGPVPLSASVIMAYPTQLVNVGGLTLFSASYHVFGVPGGYGTELCYTDGTLAGTGMLKDIWVGSNSSSPELSSAVVIGNELLFSARDASNARQLWKTNGTTAGTVALGSGSIGSFPEALHQNGATMFCRAAYTNSIYGMELWRYSGGSYSLVRDINPGTGASGPDHFASLGGGVVFTAYAPGFGRELWYSDGSAAGTVVVKDLNPGTGGSQLDWMTQVAPNRVVFSHSDGVHGRELWTSDGTAAGTTLLLDIDPTVRNHGSAPSDLTSVDGRELLFSANTQAGGYQTWKVDVQGGVQALVPPAPGLMGVTRDFTPCWLGDRLRTFFVKSAFATADELWVTDGSSAGTTMLRSFPASIFASGLYHLTPFASGVCFAADDGGSGLELWRSDGTVAGTQLVADIAAGSAAGLASGSELVASGGFLFFAADDGSAGVELWRSDGTAAGTQMVRDLEPGAAGSNPVHLADCGGRLAFAASTSTNGQEPWSSDGTVAGTYMLLDIAFLGGSSSPQQFTYSDGVTFFRAANSAVGAELWRTNLLPGGTTFVQDIYAGSPGSGISEMVAAGGGRVYFSASNSAANVEPWTSDGTAAGTTMVADILPGFSGSSPLGFVVIGDQLYFSASDGIAGRELWSTDGTAAGTAMVCDLHVGSGSSSPAGLTLNAGRLYFSADDGLRGRELWVLPAPGASVQRLGDGCSPEFAQLAATAPTLGTTMNLLGARAPSVFGAVILGLPTAVPTVMPYSSGCATWLNVGAWFQLASVPTPPNWSLPVTLPNDPGMAGLPLVAQSLFFVPSTVSISASNGLRLTLDF